MNENIKRRRVFFGIEAHAPWVDVHSGRKIAPEYRHMTIAFLGNIDFDPLYEKLGEFPKPFSIAPGGILDRVSFLPKEHPRVACYHVNLLQKHDEFVLYCNSVRDWLQGLGYKMDTRDFLPHITIARAPFSYVQYRKSFHRAPVAFGSIHLYESSPNLVYTPCWTFPLLQPFQEIEHMADKAYTVRGKDWQELYCNAQLALALDCPELLRYRDETSVSSFDELVRLLNHIVAEVDRRIGCPFKAVSYHDKIEDREGGILEWEMIIDV